MGISEIAKQEKINAGQIWLYKEGIFWRAYEVSAYLFSCNIKKYTVKQKFIKKIDREIVFLGFPDTLGEKIKNETTDLLMHIYSANKKREKRDDFSLWSK
jgi:hypothetical protein